MARHVDCARTQDLGYCAVLRGVTNLRDEPVTLQGFAFGAHSWTDLVRDVPPGSQASWWRGGLWLPSTTLLRTVRASEPSEVLQQNGVVGSGLTAIVWPVSS